MSNFERKAINNIQYGKFNSNPKYNCKQCNKPCKECKHCGLPIVLTNTHNCHECKANNYNHFKPITESLIDSINNKRLIK